MSTAKKENPYPGKRVKTTEWRQTRFLEEFAKCANLSFAAKSAGVDRALHYRWLEDPEYVAAFEEAHKQACDAIDQEIYRRGVTGVLEPVFHMGKEVAQIRKYDTTLLIFLAKGLMPEKYRDNFKGEIVTQGTVKVQHNIDLSKLTDEQLSQLEALSRAVLTDEQTVQ